MRTNGRSAVSSVPGRISGAGCQTAENTTRRSRWLRKREDVRPGRDVFPHTGRSRNGLRYRLVGVNMVEKARRSLVESDERGNPTPQWEVFVRAEAADPMRHVGSVAAASATEAHEHASRLFGWDAADVWLCPAEAVERYSTRGLATD